jgi:ADP-heptose:LPS heptosyltransferase
MLEGLRRSIGFQIARIHFRNVRERVISFSNAVSSAQQALLIMPFRRREVLPTVMVIDFLKKHFSEENITVVTDDHGLDAMRLLPRSQFVHILVSEVSMFYLPRRSVIQRIRQKKYDLAIDLNLDLVLPSGYICKESNARVRVGFVKRRSETFYNLQIQPDPTLSKKLIYDRLVKCLQMF